MAVKHIQDATQLRRGMFVYHQYYWRFVDRVGDAGETVYLRAVDGGLNVFPRHHLDGLMLVRDADDPPVRFEPDHLTAAAEAISDQMEMLKARQKSLFLMAESVRLATHKETLTHDHE